MPPQKKRPAEYSTAEALAQLALELDAQTQVIEESGEDLHAWAGEHAKTIGATTRTEPVFTREARDRIVVEAARVLVADGLTLRGE